MQFVPTTLTDNSEFVQQEIDRFAQLSPRPERFQLDIIDGQFADNLTVEPGIVHQLEMHGMKLDLHFMVIEPLEWLREIRDCAVIDTVIAQVERMTSIDAYVDEVINELGYNAGVALDLYTPFSTLKPEVLEQLHFVQIMGNTAGFQGKEFHSYALEIIRLAAEAKAQNGYKYEISVDIGMNADTITTVQDAGATVAVIGSFLHGEDAQDHWQVLHSV